MRLHGGDHRRFDVRVGVTEHGGADTHHRAVDVLAAVEVPYFAALGPAVVRRPLFRQVHLGSLAEELGGPRNDLPGALIELGSEGLGAVFHGYSQALDGKCSCDGTRSSSRRSSST